ncbi:lysine transporter LysE [Saccharopolyspora erythraea D]|uniref:LysE family translocator n=1 Tax=Saccharopolyspora erythraea TaxID=1836 RepID=UPI00038D64BD|nr:LysE family translocator [Saccharopolyspora erythraea]EQD82041.1 lysine transporter LysE [Saccharopolyspora erythraea D]
MVSPDRILVFAATALLIIAVPGPSVLFVVGRALSYGRRVALTSVLGNAIGTYVLVIAVAMGIGSMVERSAVAFTALKLFGAAYLVFLGVKAWRGSGSVSTALPALAPTRGGLRTLWEGFAVGVANPKSIVFLSAVLPQFVDQPSGHVPVQMLVLGLIAIVIGLVSDSAWGLSAATARSWFAGSPRRLAYAQRTGSLAMIGLGIAVAVTGRRD